MLGERYVLTNTLGDFFLCVAPKDSIAGLNYGEILGLRRRRIAWEIDKSARLDA